MNQSSAISRANKIPILSLNSTMIASRRVACVDLRSIRLSSNKPTSNQTPINGFWSLPPSKTWSTPPESSVISKINAIPVTAEPGKESEKVLSVTPAIDQQSQVKITTNTPPTASNSSKSDNNSQPNDKDAPKKPTGGRFVTGLVSSGVVIAAGAYGIDRLCNTIPRRNSDKIDLISENEFLQDYINETFENVGMALGVTAATAYLISKAMASSTRSKGKIHGFHPTIFLVSLAATGILTNLTLSTSAKKPAEKQALFLATAVSKGAFLVSTIAIAPALMTRIGLYAAGVVGSISWISSTAKSDHYIFVGGPLLTGLTIATLAAASPLLLPAASLAIPFYQTLWVYGGVTVFAGFVLRDTGKIVRNGERVERGEKQKDMINEALRLYLDIVNVLP
ncbi:UNVERIFIED_CONTAM: hypothetical protein HDU68_004911 [Siphonaria sp. JEL0065]|nr:hypothetical protein HDU68_004911 [Siphonaria sp. JEL0065]